MSGPRMKSQGPPPMVPQALVPPQLRRPRPSSKSMRSSLEDSPPLVPEVYLEPDGMVELAIRELGARLLSVQPEPTADS